MTKRSENYLMRLSNCLLLVIVLMACSVPKPAVEIKTHELRRTEINGTGYGRTELATADSIVITKYDTVRVGEPPRTEVIRIYRPGKTVRDTAWQYRADTIYTRDTSYVEMPPKTITEVKESFKYLFYLVLVIFLFFAIWIAKNWIK